MAGLKEEKSTEGRQGCSWAPLVTEGSLKSPAGSSLHPTLILFLSLHPPG